MPEIGEVSLYRTNKMVWAKCEKCGMERWVRLYKGEPRCNICNHCPTRGYTGHKHSEETRKKMSLSGKGRPKTEEWKKKVASWRKGVKHTDATKLIMSQKAKGRKGIVWSSEMIEYFRIIRLGKSLSEETKIKIGLASKGRHHTKETKDIISQHSKGENNPNWRGGISRLPYTFNFKKIRCHILERDNYTCKLCNNGKDLAVHHINYNKSVNSDDNLITLCLKCNSIVNFNRGYWTNYFKGVLECQKNALLLESQDKMGVI